MIDRVWRQLLPVSLCLAAFVAEAREPGIGPVFQPGSTLGVANAVPLAPGLRIASKGAYHDGQIMGPIGQPTGVRINYASDALQVTWVPDWKILGGGYKTFIVAPFVKFDQYRSAPVPPAQRGVSNRVAMANPRLQVMDLSWPLGDGFFVNGGFGVYFPLGQWEQNALINIGANFWTFEPNFAFSYYKDGWTASLQGVYDINTINPTNKYYSGDQMFLNATFMKMFWGVNIGPVAYWAKQVTPDFNGGGPTTFGGAVAPPGELFGTGGTMSTQFGHLSVQLMVTQELYAINSVKGTKLWLTFSYRLY